MPKKHSLALRIAIALVLGCITGELLGKHAEPLGELGLLAVKLLKTLATPLVFFAIVDSFCRTRIPARRGLKLLAISTFNACVALVICLSVVHLFPAGRWVNLATLAAAIGVKPDMAATAPHIDLWSSFSSFIPQNILEPFLTNNVIAVVLLAVLAGAALRNMKDSNKFQDEIRILELFAAGGLRLLTVVLTWVVGVVPLAVWGIVSKVVGVNGFAVFYALGAFVGLVVLSMAIHVLVYYSFLLSVVAGVSPLRFFSIGSDAFLTAFSTGSSLATLPVTLDTLQERMHIHPDSARLSACVGTNINHCGILLYEVVAVLFIAQIHGISLGLQQQVGMAIMSVMAAVGIAGVPEAGLITLSLVVGSVGLPLSAVPLLLPVDWFLGRLRATTNVASDMVVAILLDHEFLFLSKNPQEIERHESQEPASSGSFRT